MQGLPDMNGWIVAAVVVALALYVIFIFNRLIRLRNLTREGWSGIDVQLKRRSDLVPNLVATVQAYAAHERTVFEEVTASRQSSIAADDVSRRASAENALQGRWGGCSRSPKPIRSSRRTRAFSPCSNNWPRSR